MVVKSLGYLIFYHPSIILSHFASFVFYSSVTFFEDRYLKAAEDERETAEQSKNSAYVAKIAAENAYKKIDNTLSIVKILLTKIDKISGKVQSHSKVAEEPQDHEVKNPVWRNREEAGEESPITSLDNN